LGLLEGLGLEKDYVVGNEELRNRLDCILGMPRFSIFFLLVSCLEGWTGWLAFGSIDVIFWATSIRVSSLYLGLVA